MRGLICVQVRTDACRQPGLSISMTTAPPPSLDLRHVNEFEGLARALSPSQSWHGGKIVVLARNHPLQCCCQCGRAAQWRTVPEEDEYDDPADELCEWDDDEFLFWDGDRDDDPGLNTFCGECAPVDADYVVLPNSPREGANCYDNVHS